MPRGLWERYRDDYVAKMKTPEERRYLEVHEGQSHLSEAGRREVPRRRARPRHHADRHGRGDNGTPEGAGDGRYHSGRDPDRDERAGDDRGIQPRDNREILSGNIFGLFTNWYGMS